MSRGASALRHFSWCNGLDPLLYRNYYCCSRVALSPVAHLLCERSITVLLLSVGRIRQRACAWVHVGGGGGGRCYAVRFV